LYIILKIESQFLVLSACHVVMTNFPQKLSIHFWLPWFASKHEHVTNGCMIRNQSFEVWQTCYANVCTQSPTQLVSSLKTFSLSMDKTSNQEFPRQRKSKFQVATVQIFWEHFDNSTKRYELCWTLGMEIHFTVCQTSNDWWRITQRLIPIYIMFFQGVFTLRCKLRCLWIRKERVQKKNRLDNIY